MLREFIRFHRKMRSNFGDSGVGNMPRGTAYTIVDAPTSYNIIVGRPALNRLGAIVSTKHLCMKFLVGRKVGSVWADTRVAQRCYEDSLRIERLPSSGIVNVLDLDLDPRSQFEKEGPLHAEELKEIKLGPE
ncbi:hypothetical protein CR513_57452, partial [Mucuna pruriens]